MLEFDYPLHPLALYASTTATIASPYAKLYGDYVIADIYIEQVRLDTTDAKEPSH
jgi:hypothetical protein